MAPVPRDLVDRLYTAHPDGFIAARDEAAAAARAAGDAEAARTIARLRKPTVAAWLVNLLAARRPDLVAELIGLAEALRRAQRDLHGGQLRELSARRRELVGRLVEQARTLARQAGPGPGRGKLPLAEVEATLHAALADEEIARQIRSGRLLRPASYAGFGEVPRPRLRLLTGGAAAEADDQIPGKAPEGAPGKTSGRAARGATQPAAPTRRTRATEAPPAERTGQARRDGAGKTRDGAGKTRDGTGQERPDRAGRERAKRAERDRAARRRALDRELTAARRDQQRAEEELERAVAAQRAGATALVELEAQLAELERRRAAAENEVNRCKLARRAAERALVAARRRAGEVQAAVEALEAEVGTAENP